MSINITPSLPTITPGRLTTPTNAPLPSLPPDVDKLTKLLSLQDTPHSRGSSSNYAYYIEYTRRGYKGYLHDDTLHSKEIPLDSFVVDVLHAPQKQISYQIKNQGAYDKAVAGYCSQIIERDRYPFFVELVNLVIDDADSITFCRNDPQIICGSYANRSPDVVGVHPTRIYGIDTRMSVDNLKDNGPGDHAFYWPELMMYIELKCKIRISSMLKPKVAPASHSSISTTPARSRNRSSVKTRTVPIRSTRSAHSLISDIPSPVSSMHPKKKRKKNNSSSGSSSIDSRNPELQCASYALELLSNGGLRSHVISCLVTDNELELLYYDRSIILSSERINFVEDSPRFITILRALAALTTRQWGYVLLHHSWKFPHTSEESGILEGSILKLQNGCVIKLQRTVFHHHGLIGRGTWVAEAICIEKAPGASADWDRPLVIKFSWPSKSRYSEQDFVAHARQIANETPESKWVLDHLPNILHSEDHDLTLLSPELILRLGAAYDARILRLIVSEKLDPITRRTTALELVVTVREIFRCYQWLYSVANIIHRDISLNNLMVREKKGQYLGVLNDFDLAAYVGSEGGSSKQRTGTKPFMAIDRLGKNPPRHMFRHDLESLFYVIIWLTMRYENGVEIEDPPLESWAKSDSVRLTAIKKLFMVDAIPDLLPSFMELKPTINRIRDLFYDGIGALHKEGTNASFDHETLGGHVTFTRFWDACNTIYPTP